MVTTLAAGESPLPLYTYNEDFDPASVETARQNLRSCRERLRSCREHGLSEFQPTPHIKRNGCLAIVGGGPSVQDYVDTLKGLSDDPENRLICLNDSQSWLAEQGVMPWGSVFMEVEAWPAAFLDHPIDIKYFVASHCHPDAFEKLRGCDVTVWHALDDIGEQEILGGRCYVAGGSTAALRTLNLGLMMGFDRFVMFGLDSSFDGPSHVYYDAYRGCSLIDVWFSGRQFRTLPYLAQQADEFRRWCINWHRIADITVYGDGLLPHIHKTLFPMKYEDN